MLPVLAFAGPVTGQCDAWCLVENPSFELPGAPDVFAGWCNFGVFGQTPRPVEHGGVAATLSGPNTGKWDISAYWQRFEAMPGDRFRVVAHAGHPGSNPIVGEAKAILNIEWRDAGEGLISFESFDLVGPASPTDTLHRYEFETGPAPAGTATARYLLGFLQSPAQETGTAVYDLADVHRVEPAGWDDLQWVDFGSTTIDFAGLTWRVKGPGLHGPGPNHFSDSPANAWVDGEGKLHLRITFDGRTWHVPELASVRAFGYGEYRFVVEADLDDLDPNVVLGLFIWEYQPCWVPDNWWNAGNEFDIEFSRWGVAAEPPAQYVAQPFTRQGNRRRFDLVTDDDGPTTHAFDWQPHAVACRSWFGDAVEPARPDVIETWTYPGPDIPLPQEPRVHVNLWLIGGAPPTDGLEVEVVLSDFVFSCAADLDGDGTVGVTDFLLVLGLWGTPVGDVDGDGDTGVVDFLTLLAAWGPC